MAEKRKAKDLDPKAKGKQVKGGRINNPISREQKTLVRRVIKRAAGDGGLNPQN